MIYKKFKTLLFPGAITFLKSVTLEAVGLGVHLAGGAHDILLQTEYALASTASSIPSSGRSKSKTNVRSNQPKDAQQGMQQVLCRVSFDTPCTSFLPIALNIPIVTYFLMINLLKNGTILGSCCNN